jgi:beta-glucanase (GH16 family)
MRWLTCWLMRWLMINEACEPSISLTAMFRHHASAHSSESKMKRFISTLLFSGFALASGMSLAATPGPFGQPASKYAVTFAEEFDGTSLNASRWNNHEWWDNPPNPIINYAVSNGTLKIYPQQDPSTGEFIDRTVDTDGHFSQAYGFFEIEAKLPYGKGPWPGFWMLNHTTSHRPEIDIFEAYSGGGPNSGWSDSNLHPNVYSATIWRDGGIRASSIKVQTPDLSAGFHKYGMRWDTNRITFYFDGAQVGSTSIRMNAPMYLLVSLWFGSASGTPDGTTPKYPDNPLEVNYVRAWKFR